MTERLYVFALNNQRLQRASIKYVRHVKWEFSVIISGYG